MNQPWILSCASATAARQVLWLAEYGAMFQSSTRTGVPARATASGEGVALVSAAPASGVGLHAGGLRMHECH